MHLLARRIRIFVIFMSFAATGARAQTPLQANGQLKVCGNQLCNEAGNPIHLRGVSMHGVQWFHDNFYKDGKALAAMAAWGADITRIPVYSDTMLPASCDPHSADGYRASRYLKTFPDSKTGFKTLVDRYVRQADSLGMYALIDWHLHFPGDPNALLETATEFFDYMSRTHGHRKNVLYEIANEPSRHSGVCPDARKPARDCFWTDCIKPYAEKIIATIRKNDPDGIVVVGTTCWSSFGQKCIDNPSGDFHAQDGPKYPGEFEATRSNRLADSNTMYTVHLYSGDGHWKAEKIDEWAPHLPLFLTEWAAQNSAAFADAGKADNAWPEARRILDIAAKHKIPWIYWNLSPGKYMAVFKEKTLSTAVLSPAGRTTTIEGDSVYAWLRNPADDFPNTPTALGPATGFRSASHAPFALDEAGGLVFRGEGEAPGLVRIFRGDGRLVAAHAPRFVPGTGPASYAFSDLAPGNYLVQWLQGGRWMLGTLPVRGR
jgi:endoglucanase